MFCRLYEFIWYRVRFVGNQYENIWKYDETLEGLEKNSTHCAMGAPIEAGKSRHLGFRPHVRGSAKNACDHAHGGGEGRCAHAKLPELECQMSDDCISLTSFYVTFYEKTWVQNDHTTFMQVETLGDELGGCKRSEGSQVDFQFFSLMSQVAHWSRPP